MMLYEGSLREAEIEQELTFAPHCLDKKRHHLVKLFLEEDEGGFEEGKS